MEPSEEQNLKALVSAAESRDVAAALKIWHGMTSVEQEGVLFALLGVPERQSERTEPLAAVPQDEQKSGLGELDEQVAVEAEQTELIPESVDALRGLTGLDSDATDGVRAAADVRIGSTEYWSQWRQRWKWSVLVAVWAMATIFAFNGKFDSFGPAEWVVGTFGSVVFSGLLIGTMANFAVALIPRPTPTSRGPADHSRPNGSHQLDAARVPRAPRPAPTRHVGGGGACRPQAR